MGVPHEPWLVALSVIVAFQGSYVGLSLAVQVPGAPPSRRRVILSGAALSLALAIWSMHFVGMLAVRLPIAIDYAVLPTLWSFLVCVLVVGFSVFAVSFGRLSRWSIAVASLFMGAGISAMHYLGMYALHASSHVMHDPRFLAGSVALAIAASAIALWLAFGPGRRPPVLLSAIALACAIATMHYTAMAGTTLMPLDAPVAGVGAVVSPGALAIVVSLMTFLISGLFFLTLVPERAQAAGPFSGEIEEPGVMPATIAVASVELPAPATVMHGETPDVGTATAVHPMRAAFAEEAEPHGPQKLPVERDGHVRYIEVNDLVAVHADTHYTRLFDGTQEYFCPLSISKVEAQLDPERFARVHRSYIVNLDRVSALRRSGDNGLLTMQSPVPYTVPVSRARRTWLKERLTLHPIAAAE